MAVFRRAPSAFSTLRWGGVAVILALSVACGNRVEWVGPEGEGGAGASDELPFDIADIFPPASGGAGSASGSPPDEPEPEPEPTGGAPSKGPAAPPPPPVLIVPPDLIWPSACGARWQYRCESYDPLMNCVCDPSVPADIQACGGYGALFCGHFFGGGFDIWVDCTCQAGAPNVASDCANPATFTCAHVNEAGQGEQCSCGR